MLFYFGKFCAELREKVCSEREARQNGSKHITHLGIDMLGVDDYISLQGETK